ncbi:hypothetical protein AKJ60_00910 [candidate division MSBL1 archaeon SCGC-AAA385M11]|nr:hypothetical protein AKJ60_00910 [candidate division MSBL1 archaeon SCGC-AAA385M11]
MPGKLCLHAPCHLCRGLQVKTGPRELMQDSGINYQENREEENCCGLGGTYSLEYPEISREILDYKLDFLQEQGFKQLVTDCLGCIMQLRGGAEKKGSPIRVLHLAEALHENMDALEKDL